MGKSSVILSPSLAVRLTWQFTSIFSQNTSYKLLKDNYEKVLDGMLALAKEVDKKNSNKNAEEEHYIQAAIQMIKSSLRTLQIIIDGRNLNFKEEDELRIKSQEKINNFSNFSKNLQSSVPRLGSMTVAGAAGGIPIATIANDALTKIGGISDDMSSFIFAMSIAVAAGIGYVVNALVIQSHVIRKTQKEKIRADYNRDLYFEQYVHKSAIVLIDLYKQIQILHDSFFPRDSSEIVQNPEKLVEDLLSGVKAHMCEFVDEHMADSSRYDIDDKIWALCETGVGVKQCPYYPKKQ
jgi:hypothetical protein